MKVTILNDTNGKHFGCELVMQTYHDQLNRVGIEILKTIPMKTPKFTIPKETDLVIVNGEGSLHRGQHSHLVNVANNYPSVLLNTVWQENPNYSALYNFKCITVRESLSYKNLPLGLSNVKIVPDVSFASTFLRNFKKQIANKDLGFTDNVIEKNKSDGFSALQSAAKFIPGICEYKRLCVGRFHAIVAASVLQIPFSAWPSNTHKIQGMLIDMQIPHLHFSTKDEATDNTPVEFDDQITLYVEQARLKIDQMFENLHNLV